MVSRKWKIEAARAAWQCPPSGPSSSAAARSSALPPPPEAITGIDAVGWARCVAEAGAGEILLTSMDRDGTKSGYDLPMLRAVTDAVGIPVIASGGGGSAEDLAAALDDGPLGGHCQAALAASIFHFGETTVSEVKRRLIELGIRVREPSVDALSGVR